MENHQKYNAVSLPVFDGLDTAKFHDDLAENSSMRLEVRKTKRMPHTIPNHVSHN